MKGFPFLDERPENENQFLLYISREIIVRSAVEGKAIKDDDLAMIPETMPLLVNLAGELRDDFYAYHNIIKKQLQFPIMNNCFCYAFAKGAESASLWHQSKDGKIEFRYLKDDALKGIAGANVTEDYSILISYGMEIMYNVFCDFQDNVIMKPEYKFSNSERWLADVIACAFFWSAIVGVDFGMDKLGFR